MSELEKMLRKVLTEELQPINDILDRIENNVQRIESMFNA